MIKPSRQFSKVLLISILIAACIVLNDARPSASQIRMPSSELDRYNEPTGSDANGNPTYNGCGGVSNCFPTDGPSPSPAPAPAPSPSPSPTTGCPGAWNFNYTISGPGNFPGGSKSLSGYQNHPPAFQLYGEQWGINMNNVNVYPGFVGNQNGDSPSMSGLTFVPGNCTPDGTPPPTGDPVAGPGGTPSPSPTGDGTGGTGGDGTGGTGGTGGTPSPAATPKNGEDDKGYRSTKPNFIAYGMRVFSKRFPFDVFGTAPASGADDVCPRLDILDKQFELCIILDALKMLKIPTIIAFIVWSVQSL